jgi:hypothetical protein
VCSLLKQLSQIGKITLESQEIVIFTDHTHIGKGEIKQHLGHGLSSWRQTKALCHAATR